MAKSQTIGLVEVERGIERATSWVTRDGKHSIRNSKQLPWIASLDKHGSLRARMCLIVNLEYVLHGELRVALRGGEALVSQKFLNGAQVGAFL